MRVSVTVGYETKPFNFRTYLDDLVVKDATLSDEHASASYGLPVLVIDGQAYGPGDLTHATVLVDDADTLQWAKRAGWQCSITETES